MLDDIIIFVKLVNSKKFVLLAKSLGIAQSTISRKIDNLETQLKIKLLKRDAHHVELTEKGKIIYETFKHIELTASNLLMQVYKNTDKISGDLKVILPSYFANYAITPYLVEFIKSHQSLNLTVIYDYSNQQMSKNSYDIAVTTFAPSNTPRSIDWIYSDKIVLTCTQTYIDKFGLLTKLDEIVNHLIIGRNDDVTKIKVYNSINQEVMTVDNPQRIRIDSFMETKIMAQSGNIIGCLPISSIRNELFNGELIQLLPEYHIGYINFYLASNIDISDLRFIIFTKFLTTCIDKLSVIYQKDFENTSYHNFKPK